MMFRFEEVTRKIYKYFLFSPGNPSVVGGINETPTITGPVGSITQQIGNGTINWVRTQHTLDVTKCHFNSFVFF